MSDYNTFRSVLNEPTCVHIKGGHFKIDQDDWFGPVDWQGVSIRPIEYYWLTDMNGHVVGEIDGRFVRLAEILNGGPALHRNRNKRDLRRRNLHR